MSTPARSAEQSEPVVRSGNGLATGALLTGLFLPFVGIVIAIPLGIVALRRTSSDRWTAIAGLVFALLWWVGPLGFHVVGHILEADRDATGTITGAGRLDFDELRAGDCVSFRHPYASKVRYDYADGYHFRGVPCHDPHNAQALEAGAADHWGDRGRCEALVAQLASPDFQRFRIVFTEADLFGTGEFVVGSACFATKPDFAEYTGDLAD